MSDLDRTASKIQTKSSPPHAGLNRDLIQPDTTGEKRWSSANARDHERQIVGLRRSAVSLHRLHDRVEELGRRAAVSRPQNLEKPRLAEFLCLSIEGLDDAVGEHHERVLTRQRDVGGRAIQLLEQAEHMTGRLKALDRAVAG